MLTLSELEYVLGGFSWCTDGDDSSGAHDNDERRQVTTVSHMPTMSDLTTGSTESNMFVVGGVGGVYYYNFLLIIVSPARV